MSKDWLFYHLLEALRVPSSQPERDVYCPAWVTLFGWYFLGALTALIARAFPW